MNAAQMKDKIEKLLAKAERTDNDHERDAFTAQAQRLMLKWGIAEADLEARGQAKREEIVEESHTWRTGYAIGWVSFGIAVANGMGNLRVLKSGAKSRHTLYVIGHVTDVANFWMMLHSLERQCQTALDLWWKTAPERTWGLTSREQYKSRREFILGFGSEVSSRLRAQRTEVQAETTPGAALVLVDKKAQVDLWTDEKYPRTGTARGISRGFGGTAAGRDAGARADLGGGKPLGGAGKALR